MRLCAYITPSLYAIAPPNGDKREGGIFSELLSPHVELLGIGFGLLILYFEMAVSCLLLSSGLFLARAVVNCVPPNGRVLRVLWEGCAAAAIARIGGRCDARLAVAAAGAAAA